MMSEAAPFVFGIKNRNQFILSCFNTVLQDVRLHDKWWEAGTLVDGINTRFHLQDGMELKKTDLLKAISKVYIDRERALLGEHVDRLEVHLDVLREPAACHGAATSAA